MAEEDPDLVLARACVATDPEADPGEDGDDPWWRLTERVWEDPTAGLGVVMAICELTDDMEILAVVGAGPIEELLVKHPAASLEPILAAAEGSPNFRKAFRCVWTTSMAPEAKGRVDAALAAYGGNL